ncbi:hypothetical protein BDK51DRAFT_44736 [Blyttiomyces helicus]|uniref:Uncharacterized protein n=1 Tax=Blyttiomyces helicus TaxID=388810 RepID=A0A4P9WRX8_9FUNG|nr:hypothetical protein BDK51DRAFT_44736 [Blyttiomyces helicus]|eukprot:RKO93706.1 hypothetical protein BDK51DRAFT_44736 [Blyttiomyces helicus]
MARFTGTGQYDTDMGVNCEHVRALLVQNRAAFSDLDQQTAVPLAGNILFILNENFAMQVRQHPPAFRVLTDPRVGPESDAASIGIAPDCTPSIEAGGRLSRPTTPRSCEYMCPRRTTFDKPRKQLLWSASPFPLRFVPLVPSSSHPLDASSPHRPLPYPLRDHGRRGQSVAPAHCLLGATATPGDCFAQGALHRLTGSSRLGPRRE